MPALEVFCLQTLEELSPYAGDWDGLARGVPFCGWDWLSCWWRHYGEREWPRRGLFVLCAFEGGDRLVGIAPWLSERSAASGTTLRFLGEDEVCSDHVGLLCEPGRQSAVADAMADWLIERAPGRPFGQDEGWDLIELEGVDADDPASEALARLAAGYGGTMHRRAGRKCWSIELPQTWEEYLARLSHSHRSQVRRADRRYLASGRAALHTVSSARELPAAIDLLIDLHTRRWRAEGRPGNFASRRFEAFHRDVMPRLLAAGHLQLHWLDLDGRPVAAEYQLSGAGSVYAYQAGRDPAVPRGAAGRLALIATIRRAIEQGCRAFDFLRGDEPYKAHWRAAPRPTTRIRIVSPRAAAQVRYGLRSAGETVKQWIKRGLRPAAGSLDG